MALTNEVKQHINETIHACRREMDKDIHELRLQINTHTLTEAQAEDIATRAAQKAKAMTKKELIDDVKMEIAEASISILKNSFKIVIVFFIGLAFYIGNLGWPKIKFPWG
jgi:uncharacterized membrane protein (DUF106 family)